MTSIALVRDGDLDEIVLDDDAEIKPISRNLGAYAVFRPYDAEVIDEVIDPKPVLS